MQVALQSRHVTRQLLETLQGHGADLAVFERDRLSLVPPVVDAVEPEQVTRQVIATDLLPSVFRQHRGHGRALPDGMKRRKGVSRAIQDVAFFQPLARGDKLIELADVVGLEAERQAQFAHAAAAAAASQIVNRDNRRRGAWRAPARDWRRHFLTASPRVRLTGAAVSVCPFRRNEQNERLPAHWTWRSAY